MRVRVTSVRRKSLTHDWHIASCAPGSVATIDALGRAPLEWIAVPLASTAAACLRDAGRWSLDSAPTRFDAHDWWFRKTFSRGEFAGPVALYFAGLATVCDVWLNGTPVLQSQSMFVEHEVAIPQLSDSNELVLRFHALDKLLTQRRPRPRWRSPMIENQQLRWFRTTLLGRTPGWSPPAAPVGVWRDIWLEDRAAISARQVEVQSVLDGDTGIVRVELDLTREDAARIKKGELHVERGESVTSDLRYDAMCGRFVGEVRVTKPSLWWPHTHGEPALYAVKLQLESTDAEKIEFELGSVGFRTVALDRSDGNFALSVNGVPVFCRGACWTPLDPVSLRSDLESCEVVFKLVKDAGMNMLRVGGTMVYESDEFLDACDRHGILLWQEFMFANMDYPASDAQFDELVRTEAKQQLRRLQGRPSLTVLCGNSEVEQQAAMWGAAREHWSPALFHDTLASISKEACPDVPYWPSSAHGGAFPHQPSQGTSSYYGVGAYLRPLEDARLSSVRFASECLAFANIPDDSGIASIPSGLSLKQHHAQWKARTPRDLGAGWDFEDVRDHYLEKVFAVDVRSLRYSDHDRYVELSRIVTGEVMAATFAEWRRAGSSCKGALVWVLKDLWAGAGWGVLDANLTPKAPYYYLRRTLQPVGLSISDEGCNGLTVHIINERNRPLECALDVTFFQHGEFRTASASVAIQVPARSALAHPVGACFDSFMDSSYAYRFGPPAHDLVIATMRTSDSVLAEVVFLPLGRNRIRDSSLGLSAAGTLLSDGRAQIELSTKRFAQAVAIQIDGWSCEDNYVDLAPGVSRVITLRATSRSASMRGTVRALNATASVPVVLSQGSA